MPGSEEVAVWELGNEINGYPALHGFAWKRSGKAYAQDMETARAALPGRRLAGHSSAFWPVVGEMSPVLPDFLEAGAGGADLITWLMADQRPTSVFAVTQHIKPEVYPKVEDEATIVLTYPKAQGIIQASWNWPYNRKDMEIYGQSCYVLVPQNNRLRTLKSGQPETETTPAPLSGTAADPLSYLAAVVRGEIRPSGLSSLEVNLTAVEILDAARKSAATGRRIDLPAKAPWVAR